VENNPNMEVDSSFYVGPSKIEASLFPGESKTVFLTVENRTGREEAFEVSFEDFEASLNPEETVILLGDVKSNTSLRDYLYVPETNFTLKHGDRVNIPVTISVPSFEIAGGKFAAVVISATPLSSRITDSRKAYTSTSVVGRIAVLTFLNVSGDMRLEGKLENLKTKNEKKIFFNSSIPIRLEYRNTGDAYLNPYGVVELKNLFNSTVETITLDPWYALPNSLRTRDVIISGNNLFGIYTISAQVNRGYENIVDTKSVKIVVIPTLPSLSVLVGLLILFWFLKRYISQKKDKI
jgi:hypothetical protein